MATGDQADIKTRILAILPPWFTSGNSPKANALLSGFSSAAAAVYSLIQVAKTQSRIRTATSYFLDLAAFDFFGRGFQRRAGPEADANYRARIIAEIFRPRVTRPALVNAVTQLVGVPPRVFEPWREADTGALGWLAPPSFGFGGTALPFTGITADSNLVTADSNTLTADAGGTPFAGIGAYGSYNYPDQLFITVNRPKGAGLAQAGGYNGQASGGGQPTQSNVLGAYGLVLGHATGLQYGNQAQIGGFVTDAEIYARISQTVAAGIIPWTRLV
jgi:hypothetical protein